MRKTILVAGATGNLGLRIVKALLRHDANIIALVRHGADEDKLGILELLGAKVIKADMLHEKELAAACEGVHCVVSALSGLEDVIIDVQKTLLNAAINAGVKRFIPSDFSLDFTNLPAGRNRNLDLRRTFHQYAEKKDIALTSIFNGAFMELLTTDMPMILFKQKRILYWGKADHKLVFTTMDDTAVFTAKIALDPSTPRHVKINSDYLSAREMATIVSDVTESKFKLFSPGGLGLLSFIIKIAKTIAPSKGELYPAWQGMQYMRDMMDERGKIDIFDKGRYDDLKWMRVKAFLLNHKSAKV
jgi:NAD(P)-dependent dehydrogenase (short-subunit alcohol dehydrogenase family)